MSAESSSTQIRIIDLPIDCLDMIFKNMSVYQLDTMARTCRIMRQRVEDFKVRHFKHFERNLRQIDRRVERNQLDGDETDDTDGGDNFTGHYDEESGNEFNEIKAFHGDSDDDYDDIRSYGSNYEDSDDDAGVIPL